MHIPKCTFPSAHSQAPIPQVHTPQVHIPQVYIPKCTVTQNRCADRTGGLRPRSPTGGGSHEKRKPIKVHVKGNQRGRKRMCVREITRTGRALTLSTTHPHNGTQTQSTNHKNHTDSGQRAVATRPSTEQDSMPYRGVVGTQTKGSPSFGG